MATRFLEVKQLLWSDIQRGRFGDRLPSEYELADIYGVSRMTLRRSIAELTGEGFLDARPGQGTFVIREPRNRDGMRTIGILVAWDVLKAASDPYYGPLFIALTAQLGQHDCLVTFSTDRERLVPIAPVMGERSVRRPVDGVIAMAYGRDYVWDLASLRVPLVLADCAPLPERSCVLPDNRSGIHLAVRHLLDLGHRHIGHLAGESMSLDGQERAAAFKEALAQNNIPLPPEWIQGGNLSVDGGQAAMMRLLDSPSGPPTAVVAANDRMALGALRALNDHGLSVPRDCSVIGFDDIDAAQYCSPPLTSIHVSPRAMAETVTSILMEDLALTAEERQGRTVRVPARLVVRASTAAPTLRP